MTKKQKSSYAFWCILSIIVVAISFSVPAYAEVGFSLYGKVVRVHDGDTLSILTDNSGHKKVRLYGIDCPENGQNGGLEAEAFTRRLVFLQRVNITSVETDQYGRSVCIVTLTNGRTLNEELLKSGHAWVYYHFCKSPWREIFVPLEQKAKVSQLGLWKEKRPMAPWNWRQRTENKRVNR